MVLLNRNVILRSKEVYVFAIKKHPLLKQIVKNGIMTSFVLDHVRVEAKAAVTSI